MTTNQDFFQQASDLLNELEIRYMEADFDTQVQLRDQLDQAMADFSKARLAILKKNIVCTPDDVKQMQLLRQQIVNAPDILRVLTTVAKFAAFVKLRFL
jgi:hypothetical protein